MHFPPHAEEQARYILEQFPRRRAAIRNWLGIEFEAYPRIYLVEDHEEALRHAPGAPPWAVAVCRRDDVIVIRLDRLGQTQRASLPVVLSHELVHHVLSHLGGLPLPRWFEEGLCVHHAGTSYFDDDTTLDRLAAAGRLPALSDVDRDFFSDERSVAIAYKVGYDAVSRFLARYEEHALRALLRRVAEGAPFESAFMLATGETPARFEREWRDDLTPRLPYLLFLLLENIETTLFGLGALLVAGAWVRWRFFRRRKEMEALDQ